MGTLTFRLEDPVVGLNVAVVPVGNPVALKVTVDENPLDEVMVTP